MDVQFIKDFGNAIGKDLNYIYVDHDGKEWVTKSKYSPPIEFNVLKLLVFEWMEENKINVNSKYDYDDDNYHEFEVHKWCVDIKEEILCRNKSLVIAVMQLAIEIMKKYK